MGRSELELDDHQKTRNKDKDRERLPSRDREDDNRDRDRTKEREKARDREKDRDREKEKSKDRSHRDRDRARDRERDRAREREREYDREYERDHDRDRDRERMRESSKDLDKDSDRGRERARDKDDKEKKKDRGKDRTDADRNIRESEPEQVKNRKKEKDKRDKDLENEKEKEREREKTKEREKDKSKDKEKLKEMERDTGTGEKENEKDKDLDNKLGERNADTEMLLGTLESGEIEVHEKKSHDARKGKKEGRSEILDWVDKSRNLEEKKKIEERIKAARMARLLMEQEDGEDSEEDTENDKPLYSSKDLAGLKVLHGVDKVMEGGAVVLTLKDRSVLDGDDINNEVDELENLEIAQQKARDEAYKAAKKKTGVYEDKFQNDIGTVRTILPQYDDEIKDAPLELDGTGGLNEGGIKRLEELKQRLQGLDRKPHESLAAGAAVASDFYTQAEMLQFNKPKKKKKLRKKGKLDLDSIAAEAETIGDEDHGSRSSNLITTKKMEQLKAEEESRKAAYMNAYSKALDASQRLKSGNMVDNVNDDGVVFGGEEDDELYRSLQRARQAALKKQSENGGASVGPQAVAVAIQQSSRTDVEMQSLEVGTDKEKGNTVVFTDTEEFCRSLQLDERRLGTKDVFAEDDEPVNDMQPSEPEGGWAEVKEETEDVDMQEQAADDYSDREDVVQEVTVGKGLSGALHLLKERGALKETVEWGGRNMDKKKSKLVGIVDQEEKFRNREILLDRVDEFGRTMTPKEAFRKLSHKFHGKGPGKMKQEKRMKQYEEEMKLKQMSSGDTPRLSMEKMREAQAKMHTPYIVISGHIKPGQTSDPRSGFATVEKESVGSLTPMLGDKKVEHFLGIKRKSEGGSMKPPLPKKSKEDIA